MFARSKPMESKQGAAPSRVEALDPFESDAPERSGEVSLERATEIARASIALSKLAPELSALSLEMAEGARRQAIDARAIADQASAMSAELEEAVQSLKASSSSIGGIVHAIKKLADQSKILAINAAIEAAKAGRAGNAFGAVAVEVGSLAARTADSTGDVSEKVSHIERSIQQAIVAAGLDLDATGARRDGLSIRGIGDKVRSIASVAQQHSAAAASVAESGKTVRALCDTLLLSVGSFRLAAHRRAARIFEQLAGSPPMLGGDLADQERFLADRIARLPMFELFYLTDPRGVQRSRNIWFDASRDGRDAVGKDWSQRPWFRLAAKNAGGETAVSDIYRSAATDSYCFTVARMIGDREGGPIGVLAGDVNFAAMLEE